MIILHGAWLQDRMLLWGETPSELPRKGSGSSKKNCLPLIENFPFDAGGQQLLDALHTAFGVKKTAKNLNKTTYLWAPGKGNLPFASNPLIHEAPSGRRKTIISPWIVSSLALTIEEATPILCRCAGKEMLAPGLLAGDDLKFWGQVLRCAGSLVYRQQFLPDLIQENKAFLARWTPVFAGGDVAMKNRLAESAPSACRALSFKKEPAPSASSEAVLNQFLQTAVDYLVRSQGAALKEKSRNTIQSFDSLHDQWLYALRSPNPAMRGGEKELRKFFEQIQSWKRPISLTASTPFRLCFRLEEPDVEFEDEEPRADAPDEWTIRYLLQDATDPSLLIPVEEVWKSKGKKSKILQRPGFSPTEYLLFSLGQASSACSPIENSLKSRNPSSYTTNSNGAFQFLHESALVLNQMGFGVILPSWWTGKGTTRRLSLRAKAKSSAMQEGGGLSLDEIITFQWQIALGDQELSWQELNELAGMKSSLVRMRGQWVHIDPNTIQSAIDFLKNKSQSQTTARDIIQMSLGQSNAPGDFDFSGVSADGWIGQLLAQLQGNTPFETIPPYEQFQGTLRPYQLRGYSWLSFMKRWGLGACLADDMGLGKTIQTLALIQNEWNANGPKPVLIVCPTSVVGNWQKEAQRFTPELPVMIHHGVTRKKGETFQQSVQAQAIVITSYALLHRDLEILKEAQWRGIILDEAQNIKNSETRQSKAARSLQAEFRIALTGTPVENNIGDLWSIMDFLNPGFLGTKNHFKEKFFIPIQAMRDADAVDRLKRLSGPFILRRLKTDKSIISDLPDKMEMKVYCNLTKEQASLYAAATEEASRQLDESEGIQRKGIVLATLMKLKQICNHPAQFLSDNSSIPDRSGKLARLTEMMEELIEVGDRALIFTQFREMGDILHSYLQEQYGQEILFLHGGTTKPQRDRMVERFQSENGPMVFILSLKAGGTGLNLTRANHVFHFDRWWNPAVENQATDRAFRIGQTKNVQVHKFLCVGTFEERIDEMIERKKEIAEGVVGTGEGWLTELSTQELKELFALRKETAVQ